MNIKKILLIALCAVVGAVFLFYLFLFLTA